MIMVYFRYILLLFLLSFCGKADDMEPAQDAANPDVEDVTEGNSDDSAEESLTYLALGDSYTIGQGVLKKDRWPIQLAEVLRSNGIPVNEPVFVAATGWTTGNLLAALEDLKLDSSYNLVSLLIGVNNQYQGAPFDTFKEEFLELLEFCKRKAKSRSGIFVLSIPDYGVTPFGQSNEQKISMDIDMYNIWIKAICEKEKIKYYDVTEISRRAKYDRDLLADDNLHPSPSMYALWVETILADPPAFLND